MKMTTEILRDAKDYQEALCKIVPKRFQALAPWQRESIEFHLDGDVHKTVKEEIAQAAIARGFRFTRRVGDPKVFPFKSEIVELPANDVPVGLRLLVKRESIVISMLCFGEVGFQSGEGSRTSKVPVLNQPLEGGLTMRNLFDWQQKDSASGVVFEVGLTE